MTLTIKLVVLAALLVGDLLAAGLIFVRLSRQGRPAVGAAICAAIAASYCAVAAILLVVVPGADGA